MITLDCEQGSETWHQLRLGLPTSSCFDRIITPLGERSKQYSKYINSLLAERMTGRESRDFDPTEDMLRGQEMEEQAVEFYSFTKDVPLVKVGFVMDDAKTMGCSPDRLIGDDGLLEIKCPKDATHVEYMWSQKLDQKYNPQIQGQLLITGRQWCDVVSHHPEMRPVIMRVQRDEGYLRSLTHFMALFQAEMMKRRELLYKTGYTDAV